MASRKELEDRFQRTHTIQGKILAVCILLAVGITLVSIIQR